MEIKLRMWNPQSKSYLYDIDNVFECLKQQHKFDGTMPDRGFVAEWDHISEGMKWEMYTGHKDYNDKEIYFGDIVEFKANYTNKKCGYMNGIVQYNGFKMVLNVNGILYDAAEETDESTYSWIIIGNINETYQGNI